MCKGAERKEAQCYLEPAVAAPIEFLFAYSCARQPAGKGIWTVAANREIMDGVANILARPPVEAVQKSSCFYRYSSRANQRSNF
jgi:hypothetical protein